MTCWPKGAPRWDSIVGEAPRIPGLQQVLLLSGKRELEIEGAEPVDWSCCGIYVVKVNGGGPLAFLAWDPPRSLLVPFDSIRPWSGMSRLASWIGGSLETRIVNPLSWPLYTPVVLHEPVGGPACRETLGYWITPPPLTPLRGQRAGRCTSLQATRHVNEFALGRFRLPGRWARSPTLSVRRDCPIVASGGGLTVLDRCSIEIKTGIYDYYVEVLYSAITITQRLGPRGEIGPFQALAVGNPEGSQLAVASPKGVVLEARPGSLTLHLEGPAKATLGGGLVAARLLVEALVDWRPVESPEQGFGNLRSSTGASFVSDAGDGYFELSLLNPSYEPGYLEFRLPLDGVRVAVRSPLGEFDAPVVGDLARILLPPGIVGCGKIELAKKKLLLRLRRARGR